MITVLGSINVDLTFPVAKLPRPGETVLTATFTEAIGGKGANQAVAAARDRAACRFIGCVGRDDLGARARAAMIEAGIDVTGLRTVEGPTGLASIWVDAEGRNMIAVASGANRAVKAEPLDACALSDDDVVVLQMEVPPRETELAIACAKRAGARVILNLAPALPIDRSALGHVDILVLNEHEADTLCVDLAFGNGIAGGAPERQLRALARELRRTVVITLGEAGAIAAHDDVLWRVAALPVQSIDTTGAGDCFVGALAAGLDRGASLPEAMRRGVVAASLACTSVGAQPSFAGAARIDAAMIDAPQLRSEAL